MESARLPQLRLASRGVLSPANTRQSTAALIAGEIVPDELLAAEPAYVWNGNGYVAESDGDEE